MARFSVVVPFDPVVHEALDSRVFTNIPDADLALGIRIRRDGVGYKAELEVEADRPGVAKAVAVALVERLLSILAIWNHGFQIHVGGVRSEAIDSGGAATVTEVGPGMVAVTASDTLFLEGHVQAVVAKADLGAENAFLERYDELPEYLRSCLELNYLLVLSTRAPNRWLLAATGLEALAIGTIGPQGTASAQLTVEQRRRLQEALDPALAAVGLAELSERVVQRVLSTTTGPVADHIHTYLSDLGIEGISPEGINRWWRVRGTIAHGGSVDIEPGDLNHLITVFQTALRRTAGAEPVPAAAPYI